MVHRSSLILTGVALALLATSGNAQSPASGKVFSRYNKPLRSVSIDMATGTITRGPRVSNRSATTTIDFDNNDLGGFVGADTGNGFCEWFDAAVKGFANGSDAMNNIVFAYCSAMLAVGSGGPGGSVKLGFYEGYTWGGGAATTTVAALTLTGLPANTNSSSFFGGFRCFFTNVSFVNLIPFADGPIGYSWKFLDIGTDGTVAGTWPFLSCVVSCSGAILQVDGQGMTDVIDEYCPPGSLRASFTFGTTSGSWTSMSMDIREATDFPSTELAYDASITPNAPNWSLSVSQTSLRVPGVPPNTPPHFVWPFTATITAGPNGPFVPGAFKVRIYGNRHPNPNGVGIPGVIGRFLLATPVLGTISGSHNGVTGTAGASLPPQLGFVCMHYAAQAFVFGGGVRLSSAIDGTTGTE